MSTAATTSWAAVARSNTAITRFQRYRKYFLVSRRQTGFFRRLIGHALALACLLLSGTLLADPPADSAYLDGNDSKSGLILAHGRGKHPTWKVVNPLRKGVHEQLGYHTLSLQMPNEDKNWKDYADDFPAAYQTIRNGITFLQQEKGVTTIYLMGHSMGSRMASAFMAANPQQPVRGLVVAGCRNNGGQPLDCHASLQAVAIPVLDIWGGSNGKDNSAAEERQGLVSSRYSQVKIAGANHKFEGYDNELIAAVVDWLKQQ